MGANRYSNDIDNQSSGNYAYDDIGNLIKDDAEEIDTIEWTVYGKVKKVSRTATSSKPQLEFAYDASGNRVLKIVRYSDLPIDWYYTYYTRDAQGNILATYTRNYEDSVIISADEYNWLIDSLVNEVGIDSFAEFFVANYQSGAAINEIKDHLAASGDLNTLVKGYGLSYYESYSGFKLALLQDMDAEDLIETVAQYDRTKFWFLMPSAGGDIHYYAILNNCMDFLTQLENMNPNYLVDIYNNLGLPPPIPADPKPDICNSDPYMVYNAANAVVGTGQLDNAINFLDWNTFASLIINNYSTSWVQSQLLNSWSSVYTLMENNNASLLTSTFNSMSASTLANYLIANVPLVFIEDGIKEDYTASIPALKVVEPEGRYFLEKVKQYFGPGRYQWLRSKFPYEEFMERYSLTEHDFYGSSRLGIRKADSTMSSVRFTGGLEGGQMTSDSVHYSLAAVVDTTWFSRLGGAKNYELTNHLGNVMAVISDLKIPVRDGTDTNYVSYWEADLRKAQEYYPFGMIMTDRLYKGEEWITVLEDSFTDDISGWQMKETGTLSHDNGRLKVEHTSIYSGGYLLMSVEEGKTYRLSFDLDMGTSSSLYCIVREEPYPGYNMALKQASSTGSYTLEFKATSSVARFLVERIGAGGTTYNYYLDNVVLEKWDAKDPALRTSPVTVSKEISRDDFTSSISGWYAKENGTVIAQDNGRLKVTHTATHSGVFVGLDVEEGKTYRLTFDLDMGTSSSLACIIREYPFTGSNIERVNHSYSDKYTLNFKATTSGTIIFLVERIGTGGTTYNFYLDNVVLEEVKHNPSYAASGYRFGFQGQEEDGELKGDGNSINFKYRMHDPRIGRFFAVDPLIFKYPYYSPYSFSGNRVIDSKELEGSEPIPSQVLEFGNFIKMKVQHSLDNFHETLTKVGQGMGNFIMGLEEWRQKEVNSGVPGLPNFGSVGGNEINDVIQIVYFVRELPDQWEKGGIEERTEIVMAVGLTVVGLYTAGRSFKVNSRKLSVNSIKTEGISVWQDAEATAYLDYIKADAAYMSDNAGGTIILRANATRATMIEELIHHRQRMEHGESYFLKNRNALEVEAQNELLKIGKEEGWSKQELDAIGRAKEQWQQKLDNESNSATGTGG